MRIKRFSEYAVEEAVYTNDMGGRFWGNAGAGLLPFARSTSRFCVTLRGKDANEPNTWGIFGGAIDDDATPEDTARKELEEESGYNGHVELLELYIFKSRTFTYHNFIGVVDEEFEPVLNWENSKYAWLTLDELITLPQKHFGLEAIIDNAKERLADLI